MVRCMSLEKITNMLKNKLYIYEEIWKPFTDFIENGALGSRRTSTGGNLRTG